MSGSSPLDWHKRAVASARNGDYDQAFDLLRREILLDPANQAALGNAFTVSARSRSARTAELAAWAVRLSPLFTPGWRNLLSVLDAREAPARRRAIARHAAILTVGTAPDTRRIGEIFMGLGDYARAAQTLSWVTVMAPTDVALWFALAQSRFQIRDHRGALHALDKARDAGLPREQELFWRARLLLATRRYDEADAILAEARRSGGELAARCRILMHTARLSDFKIDSKGTST
jgi:tetratricopeptide (TPR) repeat protein